MSKYFVNLPAAQMPRNAMMDFSPVNNALSGIREQNNQNRQFGMQEQQIAEQREQRQYQRGRDQKQDARQQVEWFGKTAAAIDRLDGPARQAAWQNALQRHPDSANLTPDYLDPMQGPKLVMAEAGQWRDPREDQMVDAKLQGLRLGNQLTQAKIGQVGQPGGGGDAPSSVREHLYYESLNDDQKREYIRVKRANPYLNLGDRFAMPDPLNPGAELGAMNTGIAPDRKVDGNRVIELPGVPGGQVIQSGAQSSGDAGGAMSVGQGLQSQSFGNPRITELPQSADDARKERGRMASKQRAGTTVVQDLGRALEMIPKMPKISQQDGIIGANTRAFRAKIKGTPEYEVTAFKESALSNVGVDMLQQMRDNSPTGGALGQVPFQQQQRLEQMLGSLEIGQSVDILQDNMKRIQNVYTDIMYGSAEERAAAMMEGKLTPQQNAEIERRYHKLPFDEMGRRQMDLGDGFSVEFD